MPENFCVFLLFYFVFEDKFQVQAPRGACIRRGDLTEGFLRYDFGGRLHGGAYFRNFTVYSDRKLRECQYLTNGPGVAKCPAPGQCKLCKCPTPGTDKAGKCPAVAGGLGAAGID